jgi:hypothetical protein
MTTELYRGSAKIYQFPAGGRATFGARGEQAADSRFAPNLSPVSASKTTFGGAWYHEAAIQDEASKN